jgi:hypothetical protein
MTRRRSSRRSRGRDTWACARRMILWFTFSIFFFIEKGLLRRVTPRNRNLQRHSQRFRLERPRSLAPSPRRPGGAREQHRDPRMLLGRCEGRGLSYDHGRVGGCEGRYNPQGITGSKQQRRHANSVHGARIGIYDDIPQWHVRSPMGVALSRPGCGWILRDAEWHVPRQGLFTNVDWNMARPAGHDMPMRSRGHRYVLRCDLAVTRYNAYQIQFPNVVS